MDIVKATDANFEQILSDNENVLIKFYAGWCGSCRLIAPKYKKMASNEDYNHVYFVEVDAESNPEVRAKAGVNNLPFFAAFKNGELIEGFPSSKIEAVEELAQKL